MRWLMRFSTNSCVIMGNSPLLSGPPAFLMLAALCFVAILLSRESFVSKDLPAFSFQEQDVVYLRLEGEGASFGGRQFIDMTASRGVIKLTGADKENSLRLEFPGISQLASGEIIGFEKKARQINLVRKGWLAASQRIALGIPLHPDQMTEKDWTALPGIGKVLAGRIELNRQENGEFGSLNALLRVKGIGKKSIEEWRDFF